MVKCDPFNKILFKVGQTKCCSYWPLSHFILYVIWGFLAPECWLFFSIVGVIWEMVESIIGTNSKKNDDIGVNKNVQYTNWWSGSITDLIFNSLGLLVGIALNKLCKKTKENINLSEEEKKKQLDECCSKT